MAKPSQHQHQIVWLNHITAKAAVAIASMLIMVMIQPAQAQTFNLLHTFTGGQDGAHPFAGLTLDRAGNLYGTTYGGGDGVGAVYKLTHRSSGWTLNSLSTLNVGGNGPLGGVVFGPNGTLYGTTSQATRYGGFGTVFNLSPAATVCKAALCPWIESLSYLFEGSPDGYGPGYGNLIFDQAGDIFGTTYGGGNNYGIVYELKSSGGSWIESVLHSFLYNDGADPYNGVIFDNAGNLYGTTWGGGSHHGGTVFELTYSAGSGWQETVLYSFQNDSDGSGPYSGLIFDASGNLYGATSTGGPGGGGTVFQLTPSDNGVWTFSVIYSFAGAENCGPEGSLALDEAGNLYGTTVCDGANNLGSVFELTLSGDSWTYTALHDFTGGSDGAGLFCSVIFDANGNLYGTAADGGADAVGTVWEITP